MWQPSHKWLAFITTAVASLIPPAICLAESENGTTVLGDSIAGVSCSVDPAGIATLGGPSPILYASWAGLSQVFDAGGNPGPRPPDPHAAVGPSGVLEVVNQRIAYFSKTGTLMWGPVYTYQWWTTFSNSVFDPKVIYDPHTQRFFAVLHENRSDGSASYENVAVSKSS